MEGSERGRKRKIEGERMREREREKGGHLSSLHHPNKTAMNSCRKSAGQKTIRRESDRVKDNRRERKRGRVREKALFLK